MSFATLSLVDLLAQLGLAVAFVALGLGAAGVVLGFVIGSAVGLGAAGVAAWSSLQARPDFTLIPRLVGHGLQFLPHVTAFVVADWAMRAVVANTAGPGGVAALAIAVRFASVLSLLGAAFAMAWGPIGLVRDRSDATSKIFGQVLVAYGAVSAASALLLAAVGPELVSLIAGPGYDAAALILPGFALAYAIAGTEYVLVVAAGVSNRGSLVALAASIGAIVQIVLAVIILPAAVGVATIGFIALAGRIVSFSILLRAVGGFLTLQPRRWLLLGVACALLFAATQVTLAQGTTWALGRWIIAGMVAVGAIVVGIRWSRGVGPMTFQ